MHRRYAHHDFADELAQVAEEAAQELDWKGSRAAAARVRAEGASFRRDSAGLEAEAVAPKESPAALLGRLLGL